MTVRSRFSLRKGELIANESVLRSVDLECANGVIHVIDAVLLPDLPSSSDKVSQSGAAGNGEGKKVSASQRIIMAIDRGVPLFNGGDAQACAKVYAACLQDLVEDKRLQGDFRTALEEALERSNESGDARKRAWLLRGVLDHTLARLMASTTRL